MMQSVKESKKQNKGELKLPNTGRTIEEIFQKADIDVNELSKEEIEKIIDAFEETYLLEDDIDFSLI